MYQKTGPMPSIGTFIGPQGGEARGSGEAVAGFGGRRWPGSGHRQAKTALISARFLGFCQRGPIWLVT
jgi:hypothetical protein